MAFGLAIRLCLARRLNLENEILRSRTGLIPRALLKCANHDARYTRGTPVSSP